MVIQFCRIAKIENLEIHFLFQILAVVINHKNTERKLSGN